MIYLGSTRNDWQPNGDPVVDPTLSVARFGSDVAGESMPSAAEEERRVLIAETERLLSIYGTNRSVRRYLTAFLEVAHLVMEPARVIEPRFERSGYGTPLDMRIAIGRMVKARQPLSADWLLGWYATDPPTQFRTPARRAFPEFKALFSQIFDNRFPHGLKMRVPKRHLRATYDAASGAFSADLGPLLGEIPDISGTTVSLRTAREIADEATDALDKYSRFLGRNPEGRGTVEAHALLPKSLWELFPNGRTARPAVTRATPERGFRGWCW